MSADDKPDPLINIARLRDLLGGVSDSTIDRRLRDPGLGFPKPIIMGRLRYWRLRAVEAWIAKQPGWEQNAEPKAMPTPPRRGRPRKLAPEPVAAAAKSHAKVVPLKPRSRAAKVEAVE